MKIKLIDYSGNAPQRAHHNDSGADVFANKDVTIEPGQTVKVPLGVGVELPDGYDIVVHCKSGLSSKGIYASNAPVDAGYTGEVHAILTNLSSESYTFAKGDKVGQFVVRPVIYADFVREIEGDRGANGFGSTGK